MVGMGDPKSSFGNTLKKGDRKGGNEEEVQTSRFGKFRISVRWEDRGKETEEVSALQDGD